MRAAAAGAERTQEATLGAARAEAEAARQDACAAREALAAAAATHAAELRRLRSEAWGYRQGASGVFWVRGSVCAL